jgi:predicted DNA-binding transcriptional regulator AlpA
MKMAVRILRLKQVIAPNGRLPVSKSKLYDDFILSDPADSFIPGTDVKRLRPVPLGGRCVGFVEEEVDRVNEALVALRDATPFQPAPKRKSIPARPPRRRRQGGAGNPVTR